MWCGELSTKRGTGVPGTVRSGYDESADSSSRIRLDNALTFCHAFFRRSCAHLLMPIHRYAGEWAFVFSARPEQIEK